MKNELTGSLHCIVFERQSLFMINSESLMTEANNALFIFVGLKTITSISIVTIVSIVTMASMFAEHDRHTNPWLQSTEPPIYILYLKGRETKNTGPIKMCKRTALTMKAQLHKGNLCVIASC